MTKSVFLAHPLSTSDAIDSAEHWATLIRVRLIEKGMDVLPTTYGADRIATNRRGNAKREILTSNIAGVELADILVLLLTPAAEPSSIWVELGIAMLAKKSVVIIGPASQPVPFLARLLLDCSRDDKLYPRAAFVAEDFSRIDAGEVVESIVQAIERAASF